jgi:hypothetical protein
MVFYTYHELLFSYIIYEKKAKKKNLHYTSIGLYELLGNPTTYLIEPPRPWKIIETEANWYMYR